MYQDRTTPENVFFFHIYMITKVKVLEVIWDTMQSEGGIIWSYRHKEGLAEPLTGPGRQCLTMRNILEWPWPSPRGNPVVYLSMSRKERHKMLRGCIVN